MAFLVKRLIIVISSYSFLQEQERNWNFIHLTLKTGLFSAGTVYNGPWFSENMFSFILFVEFILDVGSNEEYF